MSISLEKSSFNQRLQKRATVLTKIRSFFAKRKITEVETPLLLPATNPAPYLVSFSCDNLYLQTSPEFAMKRVLAQGSGDIYQICKAFRKGEEGRLHNQEFTILEWYRVNLDHQQLMTEVEELLIYTLNTPPAKHYTYSEVCEKFLGLNPLRASLKELKLAATNNNLAVTGLEEDPDLWLQLLFTGIVEPNLEQNCPVFIYDFPPAQAMLAKIRDEPCKVASRFEVYYRGIELANGFHELNDPKIQRQRFNEELAKRHKLNLPPVPLDEKFLSALATLPNCSGVALGVDRLLLLATDEQSLAQVLSLPST